MEILPQNRANGFEKIFQGKHQNYRLVAHLLLICDMRPSPLEPVWKNSDEIEKFLNYFSKKIFQHSSILENPLYKFFPLFFLQMVFPSDGKFHSIKFFHFFPNFFSVFGLSKSLEPTSFKICLWKNTNYRQLSLEKAIWVPPPFVGEAVLFAPIANSAQNIQISSSLATLRILNGERCTDMVLETYFR